MLTPHRGACVLLLVMVPAQLQLTCSQVHPVHQTGAVQPVCDAVQQYTLCYLWLLLCFQADATPHSLLLHAWQQEPPATPWSLLW